MNAETDYQIHIAPPLGVPELPFIVTVTTSSSDIPYGQWLMHIPRAPEPLYVAHFRFDYKSNLYPEMDSAALHQHLLSDAIAYLRAFLIENRPAIAAAMAFSDIPVKSETAQFLAGLHYRSACPDVLQKLRSRCNSAQLREILRTITSQWPPEVSRD